MSYRGKHSPKLRRVKEKNLHKKHSHGWGEVIWKAERDGRAIGFIAVDKRFSDGFVTAPRWTAYYPSDKQKHKSFSSFKEAREWLLRELEKDRSSKRTRVFNGKTYVNAGFWFDKPTADFLASKIKKAGGFARVVPEKMGDFRGYRVYSRGRRK